MSTVIGNPEMFTLLFSIWNIEGGVVKSCSAMEIDNGCIVHMSTPVGEAMVFVPNVFIRSDVNGGYKLSCGDRR